MGQYIAYCSYHDSEERDVLHELSQECSTEEEAQIALADFDVPDRARIDECDVFEKEYCQFDGSVWRPTKMAYERLASVIFHNERMRMIDAYKVRFVHFNKKNGVWFAHLADHPEPQLRMEYDSAFLLDQLTEDRNLNSMVLVLAGEYPYDDYEIRLIKINQDDFGADYRLIDRNNYLPFDLQNSIFRINYIPSTLFGGYPQHLDILKELYD